MDDQNQVDSPEETANSHLPQRNTAMAQNPHVPPPYMPNVTMDPQQALAYSNYVQQQRGAQYMPQSGLPQHTSHQS